MNKKKKKNNKAPFPISVKISLISSIVIIITLCIVTILDIGIFQKDAVSAAKENNAEINRRLAIEAEVLLSNVQSASKMLVQMAESRDSSVDPFWKENQQIAAIYYRSPGRKEQVLVNNYFLSSRGIIEDLVVSYFNGQQAVLNRAAGGETILLDAESRFSRSLLAMFFPWQNGGTVGVLFSPYNLRNSIITAQQYSYMYNTAGNIFFSTERKVESESIDMLVWKNIKETSISALEEVRGLLAKYDFITIKQKEEKRKRAITAFTNLNSFDAVILTSTGYDEVYKEVFALIRRNIYIAIALIIISSVFIWLFSRTLSVPINSLVLAFKQIKGGNFLQKVKIKNRDEIGILASKFNKMCDALNVFYKYAYREIAVGIARGDIKPGGITKHGTIFCSRIRDFSLKLEHFSQVFGFEASGKVINWLNSYFSQMIDCVEKTDGAMDKFAGDAIMAHWGIVSTAGSPRKDAFNCVKAALMMRKVIFYLNKERKAGDPESPPLYFGCGINSGTTAAGQLGNEKYMEYTVVGDTINIASRMEELAMELGVDILISEDTWRLVGDLFSTDELPAVKIKEKEKPVRLFAVINFTGEQKGPQTLDEVRSILGIKPQTQDLEEI